MPGLAGYIFFKNLKVREDLLDDMLEHLRHKKWHKKESYYASFVHVGRVHLGIYNPEPQPSFNETRELFAFMDGKIYDLNFKITELKEKGHRFILENDPEFCLHAYEQYGKEFVQRLNGSFLLLIGDVKNQKVLLFTDRFGTRPLYYFKKENTVVFASEVKAILEDESFKRIIDEEAFAHYFVLGKVIGDKTFFKGIKALPPASILEIGKDEISIHKYWKFAYCCEEVPKNAEKIIIKELVNALKKSVAKCLKDSHRYAFALSGGLDSRVVLSAVPKKQRNNVIAFTIGDHGCDEIKVANIVARNLKVRHEKIEYDPSILPAYFEEVVYLTDGMDDISVSDVPFAYNRIREFADVSIEGFAMDLFLGGSFLDSQIFAIRNDSEFLNWLNSKMTLFTEDLLSKILNPQWYQKVKGKAIKALFREIQDLQGTYADKADQFFMENHVGRFTILGSVLSRNYLEENFPTLDNEFIDIILKIPPQLRFRHKIYTKFLRQLAPRMAVIPYQATMVPPVTPLIFWKAGRQLISLTRKTKKKIWKITKGHVLFRDKHGYLHVDEYIRTNAQWKNAIHRLLLNEKSEIYKNGFFRINGVRRLIEEHESGRADHAQRITHILTFELFLRKFLKTNNPM
jgi:asparagine synthase (glutamine-hydrolysing)